MEDFIEKIKKIATTIEGVYIIEPTVFGDNRGYFMETYSDKEFADVFICRTYKKPYQKFTTVEEVLRQLNTYDINNLDIEYYKSLDINRELVEKYEGCKRRK